MSAEEQLIFDSLLKFDEMERRVKKKEISEKLRQSDEYEVAKLYGSNKDPAKK